MSRLLSLLVVVASCLVLVSGRDRIRDLVAPSMPSFPLYNAAVDGLRIPALGVGLGGYGFNPAVGYGGYPECFSEFAGCGPYTERTVLTWIKDLGAARLDAANTYGCDPGMGRALRQAKLPRDSLFVLEKIGPGQFDIPLGYNETHIQFRQVLENTGLDYVDLLLIHWPAQVVPQSSDPYCRMNVPTHDERLCRLSTWKAMLEIFDSGKARAVGVSNFNVTHLQEIVDSGMRLPAYNQCPFHLYRSRTQQATRDFCAAHNITFGGYSPLGVPDDQIYPSSNGMAWTPMADDRVTTIAAKHSISPAQVLLQWQWQLGIPTQARSQNRDHMAENIALYGLGIMLSDDEMSSLNGAPQDLCSIDGSWYECANVTQEEADRMVVKVHKLGA